LEEISALIHAALLTIENRLRRSFAHVNPRARSLQARSKHFNCFCKRAIVAAWVLHRAMLFEKLVQQHRIYRS
jgi:hypothetical protein